MFSVCGSCPVSVSVCECHVCSLSFTLLYEPVPGFLSLLTCICVCARACSVMRMVLPIHVRYLCVVVTRSPAGLRFRVVCFLPTTLPPSHTHSRTRGHQCERPIHLFLQHFLHLFWFVHSSACVHTCLWHIPFLSPASIRCHLHSSHHHPHFPSFTPLRKSVAKQCVERTHNCPPTHTLTHSLSNDCCCLFFFQDLYTEVMYSHTQWLLTSSPQVGVKLGHRGFASETRDLSSGAATAGRESVSLFWSPTLFYFSRLCDSSESGNRQEASHNYLCPKGCR